MSSLTPLGWVWLGVASVMGMLSSGVMQLRCDGCVAAFH